MAARKNVQNAHISEQVRAIHMAMLDIVSAMNRPQRDAAMIDEAGIKLDRALFPLLVGIGRFGPIGVVDLADRAGRDYTTVSRQVAKLDDFGLVERKAAAKDARVREAVLTVAGRQMVERVDRARVRIGARLFEDWEEADIDALARLVRKLADALGTEPASASSSD